MLRAIKPFDLESIVFHQVLPLQSLSPCLKKTLTSVNRLQFLPSACRFLAYLDAPIILKRRCEFPFYALAILLENLVGHETPDHVTVISAGAGYSATLLSHMAKSVEAFEPDSVLFARLLDMTRHNKIIDPVTQLSDTPTDLILMDGGAYDHIPPVLWQKLKPTGKIMVVMPDPHTPLLSPLCTAFLWAKDTQKSVLQLSMPFISTVFGNA